MVTVMMVSTQKRKSGPSPRIAYLAAALLAAAGFACAQNGPDSAPPSAPAASTQYSLKLPVPLVLEDVVVLNRDGQPVRGLKASDLTVTEDGKPVTLRDFEEHDAPTAAQLAAAPKLPDLGPNVFTNRSAAPVSDVLNVLLLDSLNTPMADQAYIRQQMLKYLDALQPGERIAIFGLGSRLYMLQGFTSNPEVLKAALRMKGKARASALLSDPVSSGPVEHEEMFDTIAPTSDMAWVLANVHQFETDQHTSKAQMRMLNTLEAMNQLARYLSGLPGRKNLIWFSGSFPLDILPDESASDPLRAMADFKDEVRQTDDLLARSRVAVYPVDGRGVMINPALNASQSGDRVAKGMKGGSGSFIAPNPVDSSDAANNPAINYPQSTPQSYDYPQNGAGQSTGGPNAYFASNQEFFAQSDAEHATMDLIASSTGGHAFYNTNGLKEAMAKAMDDGSNFYTLAYTPANQKWNGDFRRIKVTVNRPDLELSYRRGYFADDPNAEVVRGQKVLPETAMQAAMLPGAPDATQILFTVQAAPDDDPGNKITAGAKPDPKLMKPPYRSYALQCLVDIHGARFPASSDGVHSGSLEFAFLVYNSDDKVVNSVLETLSLKLPPESYARILAQGLPMQQTIQAPVKGDYLLRIGVHDLTGDGVGALEIPVSSLERSGP